MASFGLSPHDYLQKYRINEACSLLRRHDFYHCRGGWISGLQRSFVLFADFKKLKGLSPSDYQRREEEQTALGKGQAD